MSTCISKQYHSNILRFRRVSQLTSAPIHFGLIPAEVWNQPAWIDEEKASAAREDMVKNSVIYGGTFFFLFLFLDADIVIRKCSLP